MADATESFARGVELQGSLMSRIVARNREKQAMEQSAAMLPLRLQGMENENEMNRLNIVSQGYKNQIEAATIEDQATMIHGTTALALNQDPGQLSFKTAPAAAAWMNIQAHSAFGQAKAASVASLLSRAAKLDPEHLIQFQRDIEKNNGVPSEDGIRALGEGEAYLEDKKLAEQRQALKFKLTEENNMKLEQIQLRNEGALDVAQERVKNSILGAQGIDPIRKNTFMNKARVIRDNPAMSYAAKQQALDDLQMEFLTTPEGAPTAAASPEDRVRTEAYDLKIASLLKNKVDLEIKGKNTAEVDQEINALKALKAKASGKIVVSADGTISGLAPAGGAAKPAPQGTATPEANRTYTIDDIAAAFGLSDRPAPQFGEQPAAKPPQRSGMADVLSDGLKLQQRGAGVDPAALKFWETVKKRLGALPHTHTK